MLKQHIFFTPEAIAHLCAEAFMDGALHAALYWSTEVLPPFV